MHDAVLEAVRRRRPRAVLDVGCGTGQLTARIRQASPVDRVVGCDYALEMLTHARGRDGAVLWVEGDAGCLPFQDGQFDCAVSTDAFHWFPDQSAAIGELRRVLEPGGCLMLALVNPRAAFLGTVTRAASRFVGAPLYWPTQRELRARLHAGGFRVISQRSVFRLPGLVLFPAVLTIAERVE